MQLSMIGCLDSKRSTTRIIIEKPAMLYTAKDLQATNSTMFLARGIVLNWQFATLRIIIGEYIKNEEKLII
jgi:hypothetical protein